MSLRLCVHSTVALLARLSVLAGLCLVLSCRQQDSESDTSDIVEISVPVTGGERSEKMFAELIRAFEASHPKIRVKRFDIPSQAYYVKLQIMIAAGCAPDLTPMMTMRLPTYLERNAFLPLDEFMAADPEFQARKDDIYAKSFEGFRKDGKLYGLAYAQNLYGFYYNKTIFDNYNKNVSEAERIEYPISTWDLKRFIEVARRLTRDTDGDGRIDQWGTITNGEPLYVLCPILRKFGADLFNADKTRCTLDDPKAIAAMEWYFGLPLVDRVAPSPVGPDARSAGTIVGGPEAMFMAGKIAMWEAESEWRYEFANNIRTFEWDVAEPPKGVARHCGYECFGMSITRSSKHPKEAWQFISFMISPEGQKIMAKCNVGIPVLKSLCQSPESFMDPSVPPVHKEAWLKTIEYGQDIPSLKNFQEVEAAIVDELDWGRLGRKSADEACKAATVEANRLLAENGK